MFDFKAIAQQETSLCPLMAGREKLTTDDVVGKELTIVAFDFAPSIDKKTGKVQCDAITGEVVNYGVVLLQEFPNAYYCVGTVFTKVCRAWANAFDGDAKKASEELESYGGVRVLFERGKSSSTGNPLVNVKIL